MGFFALDDFIRPLTLCGTGSEVLCPVGRQPLLWDYFSLARQNEAAGAADAAAWVMSAS